jgi:hypothetical protein
MLLVTGYWLQVAGCKVQVAGYWLLVAGYWFYFVLSHCERSAINYLLFLSLRAKRYKLSIISVIASEAL